MRLRGNVPCIMEGYVYRGHFLALLLLVTTLLSICYGCVPGCQCTMAGTGKRQKGRKVDCAQHSVPLKSLASLSFPPDTVHLNLAHNALIILKQASFIQLSSLQKLNLSSNQITIIEPGAFDGLQSLKKLDLSSNLIGTINSNMFTGLPSLEKLFLSDNRISVIPDGTFNDLRSLKRIEFNSDYLQCDCHLKWILKWTKTRHVRIPGSTVCALPAKMKGQPLSQLQRKDLHCDHKLQLPIFDIRPAESQLVFQGDKLPFECHASVSPGKMEIAWFRGGQLVTTNKTIGVFVYTSHNLDRTVINHRLVVESLDTSHAGEWSCVVTTATGNLTKTVHVDVRTPEVLLECPPVTNRTAKGTYIWDKSMAGLIASQPCQRGEKGDMATYKCGLDGRWKSLNISVCNFMKDITRKLARLAKADADTIDIPALTSGISKALSTATESGEIMDYFDVMYMTKVMDMLFPHAVSDHELASLLVALVSNVSSLPQQVVNMAQTETKSSVRMVTMLEQISEQMNPEIQSLEWTGFSENVAVVVLNHQQVSQTGITCILHGSSNYLQHGISDTNFYCSRVVPELNAPVYVRIPALHPSHKSQKSFVDSYVEASDNYDIKLTVPENDIFGNNSVINSSLVSSEETIPVTLLETSTSTSTSESDHVSPSTQVFTSVGSSEGISSQPLSSFFLSANQLETLNISSHHFSRLSKPVNISSKNLLNLPSSIDITSNKLFPFVKNSVFTPIRVDPTSPYHQPNAYIILYKNGKLFPVVQSELGDEAFRQGNWAVITPVISVSLGGQKQNLSNPVVITFEVTDTRRPLRAAYYDFEFINGFGGWRSDGCEIVQQNGSIITVRVLHLSNFALLQDISYVYRLAAFAMEPVIYVGSGVCMFCLLLVIITFIACFGYIGIPKKIKHAVVNICFSTLILMSAFVLGINRTETELLCQIVGICIHYLTLCAVFWITITSNIIYKKFIKASQPPEPPPELVPMPLPPKPILQFYFVGYGVPVIICGITAAVNLNSYAGLQYCFLEWEPSLGAFYAPVALLVAWNLVLFMRISCVVRSVLEADSEAADESDHEIHTNEIELVPSQPDTTTTTTHNINSDNTNNNNNGSSNSGTGYRRRYSRASTEDEDEDCVSVKSIPDQERRPLTQLRSLVAILFLFIVMWMCGALAIAKPFHLIIPHQGIIFSYVYGLMSSFFGVFMICYFCITRQDSWISWKRAGGCAPPEMYTVPMEVTEPATELSSSPQPQPNGTVAVKSNSNSNLSAYSQKSSNIMKAYNMKNNSNSKLSNINLILPTSSETSYEPTQDNFPNFYNPRQNGAAKKFWQKHRHHSKVMNKDINRDLNSSLTDNTSAVELDQRRLSHDTSSDGNTHLSIEIQIQAKDKLGTYSGSKEIPVQVNNYHQANSHNFLGSSPGVVAAEHSSQTLAKRLVSSEIGHALSTDHAQVSPSSLNSALPQHQRSPSAGSLGAGVHPSAFTPVQPRSNLSHQSKVGGEMPPQRHEGPVRNQFTSKIHEMDGQGQDSDAGQRPPNPGVAWNPLHSNLPPMPSHPTAYSLTAHSQQQHYPFDFGGCQSSLPVNPHTINVNQNRPFGISSSQFGQHHAHPPPFNIPPSPYLIQSQTRGPGQSMSPGSSSSHAQSNRKQCSTGNSWRPVSGGDSSDSSRPRQKRTHPGNMGRTVTYAPQSPVMSDSQAYEPRYMTNQKGKQGANKTRSVDSEHHSDPTHRKKHHRSDRHSRNKLTNKQRSLGWDEQFRGRPSKVNYVYVNHMYRDKVMHKLIKQASESDDLAKKAFWLPRSASEYDRLTQKGFCNVADDSSSTSADEDSLEDYVWVRQSSGSDFNKKETSV